MAANKDAAIAISCLGRRLTAYAVGIVAPSHTELIATGEIGATALQTGRLDLLAQWVNEMRSKESDPVIQALAIGSWPELEDAAPIELFHEGHGQRALEAARSYQ